MSSKLLTWAAEQRTGRPARKAVLREIADQASDATNLATVSFADIARRTEMSYRNVQRCVEELETVCKLVRRERLRDEHGYLAGFQFSFPTAPKSLPDKAVALPDKSSARRESLPDNMSGQDLEVQELDLDLDLDLRTKPPSVETPNGVSPSGATESSTQQILADYIDKHGKPPTRTVGQLAQEIKILREEGFAPAAISAGLERMAERQMMAPKLLSNFVAEAALPPAKPRSPQGRSLMQVIKDVDAKHTKRKEGSSNGTR